MVRKWCESIIRKGKKLCNILEAGHQRKRCPAFMLGLVGGNINQRGLAAPFLIYACNTGDWSFSSLVFTRLLPYMSRISSRL